MTSRLCEACFPSSHRTEREIFFACGGQAVPVRRPIEKTWKKQLTQRRQCGKIIPVADEAAPFERAMKKISKNHLTNLYECGKIIKSLEERWFFENWTVQRTNQADVRGSNTEQWIWARQEINRAKRTIYHGEFDPGSGRTLAACLTHASRTRGEGSLLLSNLVANGWVTRKQPAFRMGTTDGNDC